MAWAAAGDVGPYRGMSQFLANWLRATLPRRTFSRGDSRRKTRRLDARVGATALEPRIAHCRCQALLLPGLLSVPSTPLKRTSSSVWPKVQASDQRLVASRVRD